MNWDAIGATAELLGAVGVIASLVYLATQIRQSREQMQESTRATRSATYHQGSEGLASLMNMAGNPPDISRVARSTMTRFEGLSEDDG